MPEDELDPYLEEKFPKLRSGLYKVKSPKDRKYNCLAFAANDTQHNWQYTGPGKLGGYFWPEEVEGDSLDDVIKVYGLLGFKLCDTSEVEPDIVKIAIYIDRDLAPSHVARQTRRGTWKSKLGRGKDIEHGALELLEGDEYGKVVKYMKRQRHEWEDIDEQAD
jgi:hypothetical protein